LDESGNGMTGIDVIWGGAFTNREVNELHAEAFETRVFRDDEWDWQGLTQRHSLGWVTARRGEDLVGFANVVWDGLVHAWIQDVMVARSARHRGTGVALVRACRDAARESGCESLHVDFDDDLRDFYFGACGFEPTNAGLIDLTALDD
jgi:GNAT superfamily N-acetyltransferase